MRETRPGPHRRHLSRTMGFALLLALPLLGGCGDASPPADDDLLEEVETTVGWETVQDTTDRVATIDGLSGPESVRYDPRQDVYFVSNFNGGGNERNADGFITRAAADGTVEELRFMVGTDEAPLHAPRGMYIVDNILWVADIDGTHAFHRETGEQLAFIDFSHLEPGFLNDVAADDDGEVYVTDSGIPRLYRILGVSETPQVEVAIEDEGLGPPNGITWDADEGRFIVAPWGEGETTFRAWTPGAETLEDVATSPEGGRFDGIEIVGDRILVASQVDESLHLLELGEGRLLIHTPGRPADIGIDTRRYRVAVPYIALDRVDIWQLPAW
jgi:sugar lactone lactonase YvrE